MKIYHSALFPFKENKFKSNHGLFRFRSTINLFYQTL